MAGVLREEVRGKLKIKITFKSGNIKYYKGKDKHGNLLLANSENEAKDYSPRAQGSMNQLCNRIMNEIYGAVKCEYI